MTYLLLEIEGANGDGLKVNGLASIAAESITTEQINGLSGVYTVQILLTELYKFAKYLPMGLRKEPGGLEDDVG